MLLNLGGSDRTVGFEELIAGAACFSERGMEGEEERDEEEEWDGLGRGA
jgi:hypothetical protein